MAADPPGAPAADDARTARPAPTPFDEALVRPRGRRRRTDGAGRRTPRRDRTDAALAARAGIPIDRARRVVIASRKGGVGKTTVAVALGHALARHRLDRILVVDADPGAGTLAHRVQDAGRLPVEALLAAVAGSRGYADIRRHTTRTPTGLEVLAPAADPTASRVDHPVGYLQALHRLNGAYDVLLLDTGTGVLDGVTAGVLDAADQLVLVARPALDEARAADATLDWLQAHGAGGLAADAVVALNRSWPVRRVDDRPVARHFAGRCRAVVQLPFDPHLDAGGALDPDLLLPATARAHLELAAAVADGFALPSARRGPRGA